MDTKEFIKNLTKEQVNAIEQFLRLCIVNNNKCQHCTLRHENNTCYFAVKCFLYDGDIHHNES